MAFDLFAGSTTATAPAKTTNTPTITPSKQGGFDLFGTSAPKLAAPTKTAAPPAPIPTHDFNGQQIPFTIPTKNLISYDAKTGIKTFKQPDAVGGGVYQEDADGNIIKNGHTDYGGEKAQAGFQRDDIIPASAGGLNSNKDNIRMVPLGVAHAQDKVETQNAKDIKSGAVQPKAAIAKIISEKQTIAEQPHGFWAGAGNVLGNVGRGLKTGATMLKPSNVKESLGFTPKPEHQVFKIGENLTPEQQRQANVQIIKEEQLGSQPVPQTPTNMNLFSGAKDLARLVPRAVAETAMSFVKPSKQDNLEPVKMGGVMRFLMGDETLKPLATQAVETEQQLKDNGFGKFSTPLAVLSVATNDALSLSPLVEMADVRVAAKNTLKTMADLASKESKIEISFADAQKIVNGTADVDPVKLEAFKKVANDHPDLLKAFKQEGGLTVTKTEETKLSSFIKKVGGEKPATEAKFSLFEKSENPTVVPKVTPTENKPMLALKEGTTPSEGYSLAPTKPLPQVITPEEAKGLSPQALSKYIQTTENGRPVYIINRLPEVKELPAPAPTNLLEAPKPGTPLVGNGFTATDKPNKEMVKLGKALNDYRSSVQSYNQNPTPTKLRNALSAKANYESLRNPTAPVLAPVAEIKPEAPKEVVTKVATPKPASGIVETPIEKLNGAKNSIAQSPTGIKEGGIERAKAEIQNGTARPVRIRTLEDGSTYIEDGRHRIQAAKELGLKTYPVEDVSHHYTTPKIKQSITPPETRGEIKTSKLAQGVESKAIEKKLTKGFEGLPEYSKVSVKDQAKGAADLIKTDIKKAIDIAMGNARPPEGLLPESVFVAVEEHAVKTGDVGLLRDLATSSNLTSEATGMGQRIRMLAERDPESPVAKIQEIAKAKEEAAVKKHGSIKKAKVKIKEEIKTHIAKSAPKAKDWAGFLEELKCV